MPKNYAKNAKASVRKTVRKKGPKSSLTKKPNAKQRKRYT